MAIIREAIPPPLNEEKDCQNIKLTCPVCKTTKNLKIPKSIINDARQLTTVSIPKGIICNHHFQAFVDKNFAIRGYQKVDFELAYDLFQKKNSKITPQDGHKELIIDDNYFKFNPLDSGKFKKMDKEKLYIKEEILSNPRFKTTKSEANPKRENSRTPMSLEEIYNEFWELIDDDNNEFKHFIDLDNRRKRNDVSSS